MPGCWEYQQNSLKSCTCAALDITPLNAGQANKQKQTLPNKASLTRQISYYDIYLVFN